MTRRFRPRKEFKFWLYHDLADDTRLMEYIGYLRKTRQFAKFVRNGLRLMWTLGEGDLSVLFELFPALRSQFMPKGDDLIEQFRQMLLQHQATIPEFPKLAPPASGNPKSLPVPHITLPAFDDEDTLLLKSSPESDGIQNGLNFMGGVLGILNISDESEDEMKPRRR